MTESDDMAPHTLATPWLLRRVNQRYRAAMAASLRQAGLGDLPQPGYWALGALSAGAVDASELVVEMGVSKQAISKLVDSLVELGFVVRLSNAADRRRTNLVLTDRGRDAVTVIEVAISSTEVQLAAELGTSDLEPLRSILARLNAHRDRSGQESPVQSAEL
jgi:DNA-binding MarR family transcriptional regulator